MARLTKISVKEYNDDCDEGWEVPCVKMNLEAVKHPTVRTHMDTDRHSDSTESLQKQLEDQSDPDESHVTLEEESWQDQNDLVNQLEAEDPLKQVDSVEGRLNQQDNVKITEKRPEETLSHSRCMLFSTQKTPKKKQGEKVCEAPPSLALETSFPALLADPKMQARKDEFQRVQAEHALKKAREDAEHALKKAREDAERAERQARVDAERRLASQKTTQKKKLCETPDMSYETNFPAIMAVQSKIMEKKTRDDAQHALKKSRKDAEQTERRARLQAELKRAAAERKADAERKKKEMTQKKSTTQSVCSTARKADVSRAHVGELVGPQAGGRVHFSGCLMWDEQVVGHCSIPYVEDQHSEYVGEGRYASNLKAFPKAIASTFDAVAVDAGTRVVIYSEPNFKGKVLWDRVGPAIVCNTIWKTNRHSGLRGKTYSQVFKSEWEGDLNSIFPPEVREFSCSDMHKWNSGSLVITGGNSIPQELDALGEYKVLSNARH